MHLIREQLNQLSIVLIFIFLHRLIKSSPPYLKNRRGPRRSLMTAEIGVHQRSFPGQKSATGQVTKGQAAQPTYDGFANEVVAWIFTCNPAPTFTALKIYER